MYDVFVDANEIRSHMPAEDYLTRRFPQPMTANPSNANESIQLEISEERIPPFKWDYYHLPVYNPSNYLKFDVRGYYDDYISPHYQSIDYITLRLHTIYTNLVPSVGPKVVYFWRVLIDQKSVTQNGDIYFDSKTLYIAGDTIIKVIEDDLRTPDEKMGEYEWFCFLRGMGDDPTVKETDG